MGMRGLDNARMIKVDKTKLIDTIKINKKEHVSEFNEAVVLYKKEALKQLKVQTENAKSGTLDIRLHLVSPVNREENYDKLISMFDWELEGEVELSQGEFNEYVLNETSFAKSAKLANSTYLGL